MYFLCLAKIILESNTRKEAVSKLVTWPAVYLTDKVQTQANHQPPPQPVHCSGQCLQTELDVVEELVCVNCDIMPIPNC